jgi:gamma-glutamylputrescine oxidase
MSEGFAQEFTRSAARAAVVSPTIGLLQIADHALGTNAAKSAEKFFDDNGLAQGKPVAFGSADWHARTIGSAVGMLLPFAATETCIGKLGVESGRATTGVAMGLLLTPTEDGKDFWKERVSSAAESGITLGTLSATGTALSRIPLLRSPIVSGALSGIPAGLVGSEIQALRNGDALPSGKQVLESVYGMSVVGTAFGAKDHLMKPMAPPSGLPHILDTTTEPLALPDTSTSARADVSTNAGAALPPKADTSTNARADVSTNVGAALLRRPQGIHKTGSEYIALNSWSPPEAVREAQMYERHTTSEFVPGLDLRQRFPSLDGVRNTDVAIIGGGFGGMFLANHLSPNVDTVLLEGRRLGGGTSSKPAAMITRVPDIEYTPIFDRYGEQEFSRIVRDMIDAHGEIMVAAKNLDTDLNQHTSAKISYTANDADLKTEFDLIHRHDPDTALVHGSDASAIFAPAKSAMVFGGEGSLNPRKFVMELARDANSPIFEDSPVLGIKIGGPGNPVEIHTNHGIVRANKLVFATGGVVAPFDYLHKYMDPEQCFIGTARVQGYPVRGNVFDNLDPDFNYFRMLEENKLLFGGGARFLNEESALFEQPQLQKSLESLFPGAHLERQWNGTIFSTVTDGLPIMEQHPQYPQLYSITGLGGIGLVNSALTARSFKSMLANPSTDNFYDSRRLRD